MLETNRELSRLEEIEHEVAREIFGTRAWETVRDDSSPVPADDLAFDEHETGLAHRLVNQYPFAAMLIMKSPVAILSSRA